MGKAMLLLSLAAFACAPAGLSGQAPVRGPGGWGRSGRQEGPVRRADCPGKRLPVTLLRRCRSRR